LVESLLVCSQQVALFLVFDVLTGGIHRNVARSLCCSNISRCRLVVFLDFDLSAVCWLGVVCRRDVVGLIGRSIGGGTWCSDILVGNRYAIEHKASTEVVKA
jgi:hypothetical protein